MAIISGLFSCFPGLNKVVDNGNEKNGAPSKVQNNDGNQESTCKGRKGNPPKLIASSAQPQNP
uniref:Uncharacterized protein n=1 Tax=Helianthus annuus TaxID=4232 RepID=A0A251RP44_HELAN